MTLLLTYTIFAVTSRHRVTLSERQQTRFVRLLALEVDPRRLQNVVVKLDDRVLHYHRRSDRIAEDTEQLRRRPAPFIALSHEVDQLKKELRRFLANDRRAVLALDQIPPQA